MAVIATPRVSPSGSSVIAPVVVGVVWAGGGGGHQFQKQEVPWSWGDKRGRRQETERELERERQGDRAMEGGKVGGRSGRREIIENVGERAKVWRRGDRRRWRQG